MAIDVYRLGYSTGGKIAFGTNPFYPLRNSLGEFTWEEGLGDFTLSVLMTAGEFTNSRTPVVQNMASIGEIGDHSSRIKVLLSDGVVINNGSISFDCDKAYIQQFLSWVFLKRKASFTVYIGTENFSYIKIPSCRWSNITASAGEGSILKVTISFMSNYEIDHGTPPSQTEFTEIYKNSNLIPYWQTGVLLDTEILKVASWELSVSQTLTPQYLNIPDFDFPAYFRTGPWDFNMNLQLLTQLSDYNTIYMGVNELLQPLTMTLDEDIRGTASVSFGGIDAMGNYQVGTTLIGKPADYKDSASTQTPFTLNF
jgi:hypothetical protein